MVKARTIADLDGGAPTHAQFGRVLAVRVDELFARAASVHDPADVAALHDMRIAGKRLRYGLEAFAPCLGPELPALRQHLEGLQDRLGVLRDLDVAADVVRDELRCALRRLREAGKALDDHDGAAADALATDASALAHRLRDGDAAGLLELLGPLVQRRRALYAEFLLHWDEVIAGGLEARLRALANPAAP